MGKLIRFFCTVAIVGLVYFGCAETFRLYSIKTKQNQAPIVQELALTEISYNNCNNCEKARFSLTYYNPLRGGINCNNDCTTTANGTRIIHDGKPITDYWFDGRRGGVACPKEYSFGTIFNIRDIELVCIDRGGAINNDNGKIRLDILYDDGIRTPHGGFNNPKTYDGVTLAGDFEGCICK